MAASSFVLCFIILFSCVLYRANENFPGQSDRVVNLPGQPPVKFQHYAGYVKVDEEKDYFYWFFEAEEGVSQKPLVLWLSFGPGCSAVAFGAAQELGPFLVRSNPSQLLLNKYSWNKVANIIFMEAPIGVGFSYSNKSQDLMKSGDEITAKDSHTFLINWFERFPMFKSNDFYIAGESYAGHFAPQLAKIIYDQNKLASKSSYINLKGFMIGNAVLNHETDSSGMIDFGWSHGIISDELYGTLKACFPQPHNETRTRCELAISKFFQAYDLIDIFNIYTPVCSFDFERPKPVFPRSSLQHDIWHDLSSGYDPCTTYYVTNYINREDVQKALHANVTKLPYPYTPCTTLERWDEAPQTVLPLISKLIKAGLRIWVYSGDTDAMVPLTSTRYSINKMHLPIKQEWRAWFHNHQVGGWVVEYEGLTLATVRGAGHFVPLTAPGQSLSLISHFLTDSPLPSSRF